MKLVAVSEQERPWISRKRACGPRAGGLANRRPNPRDVSKVGRRVATGSQTLDPAMVNRLIHEPMAIGPLDPNGSKGSSSFWTGSDRPGRVI